MKNIQHTQFKIYRNGKLDKSDFLKRKTIQAAYITTDISKDVGKALVNGFIAGPMV